MVHLVEELKISHRITSGSKIDVYRPRCIFLSLNPIKKLLSDQMKKYIYSGKQV